MPPLLSLLYFIPVYALLTFFRCSNNKIFRNKCSSLESFYWYFLAHLLKYQLIYIVVYF